MMAATAIEPKPGSCRRAPAGEGERRCLVTREAAPREGLVRFVIGPEGGVVPDVAERLPGRGLWVSATRAAIETAATKGLFAKAAKAPARAPADLADQVERLLLERALGLLGFARRAGALVYGFERVTARLEAGGVAVLIEASDAAPESAAKMSARAGACRIVRLFSRDELGGALGRPELVHLALADGKLAEAFLAASARLAGLRGLVEVGGSAAEATNGKDGIG